MAEHDPIAVVRRFCAASIAGDLDAILDYLTDMDRYLAQLAPHSSA